MSLATPALGATPPPLPDELTHTPVSPDLLGQRLLAAGLIALEDLQKALAFQAEYGGRLGGILVRIGALAEEPLLTVLADQLGMPILTGADVPDHGEAFVDAIERGTAEPDWWLDQEAVAWLVEEEDGHEAICVIARDPVDPTLRETVETGLAPLAVHWALVPNQVLDRALDALDQLLRLRLGRGDDVSHLRELAEEAPVIELVGNLLGQAMAERASDIHVEPSERNFAVRFRIDGILHTRLTLPRERFDAVASRIKLIAGMDIAERRLPQDGRLTQRLSGQDVDLRVSALPGTYGESLVLRLLVKGKQQFDLVTLGLAGDHLEEFRRWLGLPNGVILVSGPTGSGKSTTLYAGLAEMNTGRQKIVTVENPVEYEMPGIHQVQVHPEIDYDFARALRSILRQDPDVIMIGEIRDAETARIAVQASLTGHLVLSTVHTNDAVSAFNRLVDIGVEPFLVTASLRGVMAQRLVRKLCDHCAAPDAAPAGLTRELAELGLAGHANWRKPVGCKHCQGTGYRGRIGIYELVTMTDRLQEAVQQGVGNHRLAEIARAAGARTMRGDGLVKAAQGLTTVAEVLRVAGAETQPD